MKRDIALLKKIDSIVNAEVFVFDVAVEKNLNELDTLLASGCLIKWFDHHVSDTVPKHENFCSWINTNPAVNTSYLVGQFLEKTSPWAIVGLCGDNVFETAESLANEFNLNAEQFALLKEMGELFNYNGYGETTEDLHIDPAEILDSMKSYENPLSYLKQTSIVEQLRNGLEEDLIKADNAHKVSNNVYIFQDEKWARRVVGVFANRKIKDNPDIPCSVLVEKDGGKSYVVSVRSPLNSDKSAAELCKKFTTGGGRVKAAGINDLPREELTAYIDQFQSFYSTN